MSELRTSRLVLRQWRDDDLEPFADLNADPEVMRYFPAPLDRGQSDAFAARARAAIAADGFGLWAVEVVEEAAFVGFVGLAVPRFEADFTPAVEVGWRLARAAWGKGYASEAGHAALAFGFQELALEEIVSFTAAVNERSRRVMERIGMRRDRADDFDHPLVPAGPLRRHVLYRVSRPARRSARAPGP